MIPTTLPPSHPLAALFAALDGHDADYRHRFMDCLAGCLSLLATPQQWERALATAAETVEEEPWLGATS